MSDLLALAITAPTLPVTRVRQLLGVSRSTLYRQQSALPKQEQEVELALRDRIQRLALEMPAYGYRRITAALHREGVSVNHE